MKKNVGNADRIIRALAAVVIAGLYFTDTISGLTAILLGLVGIILLLTGAMGFCPLYWPFSFSTRKAEKTA